MRLALTFFVALGLLMTASTATAQSRYYCRYCGYSASSVSYLTGSTCYKNPHGKYHEPYEGSEKSKYYCKFCGYSSSTISYLTGAHATKTQAVNITNPTKAPRKAAINAGTAVTPAAQPAI